jgi:hypothetical protein
MQATSPSRPFFILHRPLPLIVSAGDAAWDMRLELDDHTNLWHVAVGKLGDGTNRLISVGKRSITELQRALSRGIQLAGGEIPRVVTDELVYQGRASYVRGAIA